MSRAVYLGLGVQLPGASMPRALKSCVSCHVLRRYQPRSLYGPLPARLEHGPCRANCSCRCMLHHTATPTAVGQPRRALFRSAHLLYMPVLPLQGSCSFPVPATRHRTLFADAKLPQAPNFMVPPAPELGLVSDLGAAKAVQNHYVARLRANMAVDEMIGRICGCACVCAVCLGQLGGCRTGLVWRWCILAAWDQRWLLWCVRLGVLALLSGHGSCRVRYGVRLTCAMPLHRHSPVLNIFHVIPFVDAPHSCCPPALLNFASPVCGLLLPVSLQLTR